MNRRLLSNWASPFEPPQIEGEDVTQVESSRVSVPVGHVTLLQIFDQLVQAKRRQPGAAGAA